MKNKKIIRTFAATLAVMLCFAAFSTTAFAGGVDPDPEPLPETTEAPEEVPEETEEPTTGGIEMEPEGVPVTPEGNAALVDDFYGDTGKLYDLPGGTGGHPEIPAAHSRG